MLTDLQLERLFVELNLPDSARKLIRDVRKNSPVRKPNSYLGNVPGALKSKKMERHLKLESRTVETAAASLYEDDLEVLEYWPQPCKVELDILNDEGKRTGRVPYAPDFLVVCGNRIYLTEWREESRLMQLRRKGSFQFYKDDANYQWHYRAAEEHFKSIGLVFELHSHVELPHNLIINTRFLEDYRVPSCEPVNPDVKKKIIEIFEAQGTYNFCDLINNYEISADDIFKLVIETSVYVDIVNQRLDETNELLIHRNACIGKAYNVLLAKEDDPTLPYPGMARIAPGTNIEFNGEKFEVKLITANEALLTNNIGRKLVLPIHDIEELYLSDGIGINSETSPRVSKIGISDIPEEQLQKAILKLKALDENSKSVPMRTKQRWMQKTSLKESRIEKLLALVNRDCDKGNYTERISERNEELINNTLKRFNTKEAKTRLAAHLEYKIECENEGEKPLSYAALCKRLNAGTKIAKRHGRRVAYRETPIQLHLDYRQPIHGVRPHEVCYVDHTVLNLAMAGPTGTDLGKPVFSLAFDGNVRKGRAIYVSWNSASAAVVLMLMRDYVRRNNRLPKILVVDGGPDFNSKEIELFCYLFNIDLRYRPKHQPRAGSIIERAFGTTETEFIAQLEGNTRNLKEARMVTKSIEPFQFRKWTLPALWGALDSLIFNIQPNTLHPVLAMTPNEYEAIRTKETGVREHTIVKFDSDFLLLTSPHSKNKKHSIDRTRGVWVDFQYYWHESFRGLNKKEKYEVRIEPWEPNVVYVNTKNRWESAIGRDIHSLTGRTRYELGIAIRAEKRLAKNRSNAGRLSSSRATEMVKLFKPESYDMRIHEQQRETIRLYSKLGMTIARPINLVNPSLRIKNKDEESLPHAELPEAKTIDESVRRDSTRVFASSTPIAADFKFWRDVDDFI